MDDIIGTVENSELREWDDGDIEKARLIANRLDTKAILLAGVGHLGTVNKYQMNAANILEAIVAYKSGTITPEQDELLTWAINQFDWTIKRINR